MPTVGSLLRRNEPSAIGAERIGIQMSDEDQLDPEQSTSAIVCHHPQAKYFSV